MKNKIKALMNKTGSSLFDLAIALKIDSEILINVLFGEGTLSQAESVPVYRMMENAGLCPECAGDYRVEGGCRFCVCGWQLCH